MGSLAFVAICGTVLAGAQPLSAVRGPTPRVAALRSHGSDSPSRLPAAIRPHAVVPLAFEASGGQSDQPATFIAHGADYTLSLTPGEAVFGHGSDTVRMAFRGRSPHVRVSALDRLPGVVNYLRGHDPAGWRTGVATYARVRYDDLYPGIDLVFYGHDRALEYDLIVRPGADAGKISLAFEGVRGLRLDAGGDLVARTPQGEIRLRRPTIYQDSADGRPPRPIDGRYRVTDGHTVAFDLGRYDRSQTLVIDPVVVFSTYLGGSGVDQFKSTTQMIAVDASGFAYVAGITDSPYPLGPGARGRETAFVAKVSPDGGSLAYLTYVSGATNGSETATGVAVDPLGNAYLTGSTTSDDFPGFTGQGIFVAKLNPAGTLTYSVKAVGAATSSAIAVEADGSAFITGVSYDSNMGTTACNQCHGSEVGGGLSGDAYVIKFDPSGILEYATLIGGASNDVGAAIAVDALGQAYITGTTTSTDFPTTPGALRTVAGLDVPNLGGGDVFVTKLNASGTGVVFSTYLNGDRKDTPGSIAVDAAGAAYVTGTTESTDSTDSGYLRFPTTPGAFELELPSSPYQVTPAFVTKFTATGGLVYSTFLGGRGLTRGEGIAVDAAGRAYVVGGTDNQDFPTVDATQPSLGGLTDAFVAVLSPSGSGLVFSTYLGGPGVDFPHGVAIGPDSSAYVVGDTANDVNPHFPVTPGAFQTMFGGSGIDLFVSRIAVGPPPDLRPPDIGPVTDLFVEATSSAGAVVTFGLPDVTDNVDPAPSVSAAPASGATFPLGVTTVTVTATDASGNSRQKTFTVTVRDTTPPTVNRVAPSRTELWPPNNKMVPVSVEIVATDLVTANPVCRIVAVSSSEPGIGEWRISGLLTLSLEASRSGSGPGRTYTISIECTDVAGNRSATSAAVVVPHDQRR